MKNRSDFDQNEMAQIQSGTSGGSMIKQAQNEIAKVQNKTKKKEQDELK